MSKAENSSAGNLFEEFLSEVSRTVVHDVVTKLIVFLTGFSTYSEEPLNLFLRGPSSIGKTYVTMRVMDFFPRHSLMLLGGLSPTALVHDYGNLIDGLTGNKIDLSEKPRLRDFKREDGKLDREAYKAARNAWEEMLKNSYYRVDLENKILVFLEAPNPKTFMKLRPILSHDAPEVSYKFTDRPGGGSLRTMHVKLKGWPATIFCTTEEKYLEDLATRSFTHTPEMKTEKYEDAVKLHGKKAAFPWLYREREETRSLKEKLTRNITLAQILRRVLIPYGEQMAEIYEATLPRDMRDYIHFQGLVKVSALINFHHRPILKVGDEHFVVATLEDYDIASNLFREVFETTHAGLSGNILRFFEMVREEWKTLKVREEGGLGLSYQHLVEKYNEVAQTWGTKRVSKSTLYKWVEELCNIGYLDTVKNPEDQRYRLITVIENSRNIRDYSARTISGFFTEKDFDNWFDDLKNIIRSEHNPIIYDNWFDRKEIDVGSFRRKIIHDSGLGRIIFSREPKEISEPIEEKKPKNIGIQQSRIIQREIRDLSLQQALKDMADKTWELTVDVQGPVSQDKIRETLGWNPDFFSRVLRVALRDRILYQTPDGRIGVTW